MANILIVEDNPANMKLARLLMQKAGHSSVCAVDAEMGLALAKARLPDLILMDIQLPGMDGLAATALLKRHPATAHIPIIALTAHAMAGDRDRCLQAGCDEYDTKPIEFARLLAKINVLLPASSTNG